MVVHVNHAREIDRSVVRALERLRCAGVMLLNQAVLLRRVNDTLAAQVALSERLIEGGVVPYYLHQLDQVAGAAHFYVSPSRGREIVGQMQSVLPGYAVPRYVQDVPGRDAKTSLM